MALAITRRVSPDMSACALTHADRVTIDTAVAREQHEALCSVLAELGCELIRLPAEPNLPDAVFVEDTAIVLDELAVITRPGHAPRRAELEDIRTTLTPLRERIETIDGAGTLDGGDVMRVGRTLFVGRTTRTDDAGIDALARIATEHRYRVTAVDVTGCLHLKTACCPIADGTILVNREMVDTTAFLGLDLLDVDPGEPEAANALRVGDVVVHPAEFPRTRARIEARGIDVRAVPASELAKAEGGVTCCALLV